MRFVGFLLLLFLIHGCSKDYCDKVDLKQFEREEELVQCYPNQSSDEEMAECVKLRHANFNDFYERHGFTYYELLDDFEKYNDKLIDPWLVEHGTYLLAKALYISEPDDPSLVAAVRYLLTKGVDPFKSYKTEMAPISYLLEGFGISASTNKTRRMWEIVKEYYPPNKYSISNDIDMYIKNCRNK